MPTTTQVFLSTLKEHLKQAGYHVPHDCGHVIRCPKCSELCLEPSDMSPALLNALRMAVVAVQIRSADLLREMFVKINGTGSMFSEEELAALAIEDLHSLAYALVDADSGVGEVDPVSQATEEYFSVIAGTEPKKPWLTGHFAIGNDIYFSDGDTRPTSSAEVFGPASEAPGPALKPPAERGRVGSGIFFPSDTVRAMMKCDCAECPNGCRECQKKE